MRSCKWIGRLVIGLAAVLAASCTPAATPFSHTLPTPTAITTSTPAGIPAATSTDMAQTTSTLTPASTPTPAPSPIGPFLPASLGESQPPGSVRDWRVAPDGTLWVTTDQALASYSQENWTIHPPHGDILLGFDAAGRAWVTFEDGASIAAWDGVDWIVYGPQAGWTSAGTMLRSGPYATVGEEIITDGRGWTWLVTQKDVRVLDGEQWTIYTPEGAGFTPSAEMIQEGFGFSLSDIAMDSVGDVWVADCAWMGPGPMGQGARWFTGAEWQGQTTTVVSSGCVEDIEVDSSGRIWLGITGELWRYTPGDGWEALSHPPHDPDWGHRWGWISDIELGADGTAWVSMSPCGGASCDTGVFILFAVRNGTWTFVSDRGPADLALDDQGEGWLCTGDGLYRIEAESVQPVYQQDGFYCQIEADSAGRVWLSILGSPTFWIYEPEGSD